MTATRKILNSSFMDPSGFLFTQKGVLYRQINLSCADDYDLLSRSGLYEDLAEKKLLVSHREIRSKKLGSGKSCYKIIKPQLVPFVSYPYEWSFGMWKDAALSTLQIQKIALGYGMSLKDSSAYNIQFLDARPVLIDTLSFEKYEEGRPWVGYQQFCKHFLAPLALMSKVNVEFGRLTRAYIDGLPLDLTRKTLPLKTWLNPGLFMHLFLHAHNQIRHASDSTKRIRRLAEGKKVSKIGLLGIIESLSKTVEKLNWDRVQTEWADYYSFTNYSSKAMDCKLKLVEEFISKTRPKIVWDLGANSGRFSRLASRQGIQTVAFDVDPAAVELNYRECKKKSDRNLLPLLQDLTNPSPGIGFTNNERDSLLTRGPADTVLGLALVHHLAISNNVPFGRQADFFARCGRWLIVEFVPKSDSQVQKLLASRKDIFTYYSRESFELEFSRYFRIKEVKKILGSERRLFLMKNRQGSA